MTGPRVLIIDDDEDVRAIVRLSLVQLGKFQVLEAKDGHEGVRRCVEDRPDLVLLDLMMPDMDGLDCLDEIHARIPDAVPPVLLLSARAPPIERNLDRIHSVVRKPFDPVKLVEVVREVLKP